MKPELVKSPKSRLKGEFRVVVKSEYFSMAIIEWDGVSRVGIRWDGADDELGYPNSRGKATWFVIPKEVALAYAEKIGDVEVVAIIKSTSESRFA